MGTAIVSLIQERVRPGTRIPKPESDNEFVVKGWGTRRSEPALIYYIPNHRNPHRPHQKGITESEFEAAFERLRRSGELTSQWFKDRLPDCAAEGWCNFTTLGGVFELISLAKHTKRGVYVARGKS